MKIYDWIVVGGGITGAALSYELVQQGFSVLLLEQDPTGQNATRYSYGGLAFWSGTTDMMRQLCAEGIARHRILSEELAADTQFRELDLLLTIAADDDPAAVAATYADFAIPPQLLSVSEACKLEPLLNPHAIAGALTVKHGHIHAEKTAQAYIQAFLRAGGDLQFAQVLKLWQQGNKVEGVKTADETYCSANTIICAGGFSRALLKAAGISVKIYFTHAELIDIPPVDIKLRSLVMPARLQRFQLEATSTTNDRPWDEQGLELAPPILDTGAIQFLDGSLRLGQLSRTLTDTQASINPEASEATIRASVGQILPALKDLPGTWHHCLVSFSRVSEAERSYPLPLIGNIPGKTGIHIFSGFSNPLVIIPPLAQRFARSVIRE
ncbi:FAD-binding oxidoreductase [Chroococcidiopsis sp. FACHB-1243]|uniref:NAD(P)/FAD-dependent oxidoreductase n=1 Tax=Chroococcidiopsis sp. [FACHB-1243] TaxID=2692781 RepID=UPI001784F587|nr:FAD-binding oxidoreductase [Chroococcidiopsis sp. [FACHB-1243]]MBD2308052.1 FAD-binding oxidoreductase [Chroococcidiopsis sp. [FACHB-1243]]